MKIFFKSEYLSAIKKVDFSAAKSVKISEDNTKSYIEFSDDDSLEVKLSMSEAISLYGVNDSGNVNSIGIALEWIYDEILITYQKNAESNL